MIPFILSLLPKALVLLFSLALLSTFPSLSSYPYGPSPLACPTQIPQHQDPNPVPNTPNFSVRVNSVSYSPSVPMSITISADNPSTNPFTGFIISAYDPTKGVANGRVGSWALDPSAGQTFPVVIGTCGASADIGHGSSVSKNSVSLIWTPPPFSSIPASIRLFAVIVTDVNHFYLPTLVALSLSTNAVPPSIPQSLTVVDLTPSSITIQWEPPATSGSSNMDYYTVSANINGTEYSPSGPVISTVLSAVISIPFMEGATVSVEVVAVNQEKASSNAATLSILVPTYLGGTNGAEFSSIDSGALAQFFTSVPFPNGYQISINGGVNNANNIFLNTNSEILSVWLVASTSPLTNALALAAIQSQQYEICQTQQIQYGLSPLIPSTTGQSEQGTTTSKYLPNALQSNGVMGRMSLGFLSLALTMGLSFFNAGKGAFSRMLVVSFLFLSVCSFSLIPSISSFSLGGIIPAYFCNDDGNQFAPHSIGAMFPTFGRQSNAGPPFVIAGKNGAAGTSYGYQAACSPSKNANCSTQNTINHFASFHSQGVPVFPAPTKDNTTITGSFLLAQVANAEPNTIYPGSVHTLTVYPLQIFPQYGMNSIEGIIIWSQDNNLVHTGIFDPVQATSVGLQEFPGCNRVDGSGAQTANGLVHTSPLGIFSTQLSWTAPSSTSLQNGNVASLTFKAIIVTDFAFGTFNFSYPIASLV